MPVSKNAVPFAVALERFRAATERLLQTPVEIGADYHKFVRIQWTEINTKTSVKCDQTFTHRIVEKDTGAILRPRGGEEYAPEGNIYHKKRNLGHVFEADVHLEGYRTVADQRAIERPSEVPFNTALANFLDAARDIRAGHFESIKQSKAYMKILWTDTHPETGKKQGETFIHSFVERSSGEIFEPSGYEEFINDPRGNIYQNDGRSSLLVNGCLHLHEFRFPLNQKRF